MGLIQFVKSINREQEAYPAYEDFIVLPLCSILSRYIRLGVFSFLNYITWFQNIGRQLIFGKGHQRLDTYTGERRKKNRKFKESAWKFVYYLSAKILALFVTYNEPWLKNTRYFWVGPGDQETRRPDFGVLMRHHVATAICIVLSYIFRFGRIGSWLSCLAIHDASDVFLEIGKTSKYRVLKRIASFAFLMSVLSYTSLSRSFEAQGLYIFFLRNFSDISF